MSWGHSLCCYRPLAFSFLQVSSSKFKAATANEILLTTGISLTACVATDHPWLLGSEETHPVHLLLLRPTVPHHKAQSPEGNLITSVSSRDESEQYVFFPPPPNSSPILSECWLAECPTHLTQVWHYVPGASIRSYRLRAQPHKTVPLPFRHQVYVQFVTCASDWLATDHRFPWAPLPRILLICQNRSQNWN